LVVPSLGTSSAVFEVELTGSLPAGHVGAMHVLHLNDRLSILGGADLHLLSLIATGAKGLRNSLAVGREDGSAAAFRPNVSLIRIPGLGGRPKEAASAVRRLRQVVAQVRPDVIHLHNVLQPEVMREAAALGLPCVATVQDHRSFCPGRGLLDREGHLCPGPTSTERCLACVPWDDEGFEGLSYARRLLDLTRARLDALSCYKRLVVLSTAMARHLALAGLPTDRIRVIRPFPFGLDAEAPVPGVLSGVSGWILAAGRLVDAKGFHVLFQAWRQAGIALPLVVAGDGPARRRLEDLAGDELGRRVFLPGWIPHPAIGALLARARVFVLPSLWDEPFGIAGLEALWAGVPVVASSVGGVPEWLDDQTGWLVPPGDVDRLGNALAAAIQAPGSRRGFLGRERIRENHVPAALMEQLVRTYRESMT
jgi:glycosyltransferase involved in cell wall biosynthesis